jgi:hypothetical protein
VSKRLGLRGLIRMRSWGILALGGALALVGGFGHVAAVFLGGGVPMGSLGLSAGLGSLFGAPLAFVLLAGAVAPFVRPVARFLRR